MADTSTIINGYNIKLKDNGDGTYSFNVDITATVDDISSILEAITAIKDTDGIKKIATALPAGTNNIGKVDVNSSALPTGAATSALQTDGNTLLTAIKNTDGIKKIVDALPAGTNTIGKVSNSYDLYGATTASRPTASSVPVGTCFMAVTAQKVYQSDGTNWIEVV